MTGSRWIGVVLAGCLAAGGAGAADYDLIIAGGRVVDGTGAPWFRADVGIRGDRIVAIANLEKASASRRVDATGRYVTPGVHRHARPVRAESPGRQPGRVEDPAGHHDGGDGRGRVGRADERRLDRRGEALARQVPPDRRLEGPRRVLVAAPPGPTGDQPRHVRRRELRYVAWCSASGRCTPDADQLKRMEREVEVAMRQGARGPVLGAHLSAWLVRADARAGGAGQVGRAIGRALREPHPRRGRRGARGAGGGDHHRPRGADPGGDVAPQGQPAEELGTDEGGRRPHRACPRRRAWTSRPTSTPTSRPRTGSSATVPEWAQAGGNRGDDPALPRSPDARPDPA